MENVDNVYIISKQNTDHPFIIIKEDERVRREKLIRNFKKIRRKKNK